MPGTTDTVKAILTPGEFVIRKEAVDMIGAPMLNMINNMPEKGGHSNIDSLIEKATMSNMKGMYGGGMVQAGPKPMGTGGMVDAYAGGGMVMDQYGHGGKVKKNLKPVPQGNPGLGKLPEAVRNKMGYMREGGEVEKMQGYQNGGLSTLLSMISPKRRRQMDYEAMVPQDMRNVERVYTNNPLGDDTDTLLEFESPALREIEAINRLLTGKNRADALNKLLYGTVPEALSEQGTSEDPLMGMMYGGMANKKKKGYQDGGKVMDLITTLLSGVGGGVGSVMARRALAKRNAGDIKSDMPLMEGQIDAPMIDMDAVLARKKMQDDASFSIVPVAGEFKGTRIYQGSPEMESYLDSGAHQEYIKRKFSQMKSPKVTPFQEGGPVGPPLPPEMMGQAMNQQLSDSIDMRMQNPQGGELGVVRQESDAIEAAMKDNLARNARLALQKMRLDTILSEQSMLMKPETLESRMFIPQELIQGGQSLDIRDYDKSVKEYLESEYGPQNTLRGILRAMPYLPK